MDKAKLGRLHGLLNKLNKQAYKIDYIVDVSNGRTQSSRDLHDSEYYALIGILSKELKESEAKPKPEEDKMRKKVTSICHELGWHIPGTTKIDMEVVNKFCESHSYLKKRLNKYSMAELPKLVSQFEQILKSYYKSAEKNG
jgi:hypothetical protein